MTDRTVGPELLSQRNKAVLCYRMLWVEELGWGMSQQEVSLVRELWTLLVVGRQDRTVGVRLRVGIGVGSHCPGCRVAVGRPGGW